MANMNMSDGDFRDNLPSRLVRIRWFWGVVHCLILTATFACAAQGKSAWSQQPQPDWIVALGGSYTANATGVVTSVDLRNAWVTDADLRKLCDFPWLERIHLGYTKITDRGIEQLSPLQQVRELDLAYAENITDVAMTHVLGWRNLEHLNLRGTKVTSFVFEHISQLRGLKSLSVAHTRVTDDRFDLLGDLEALERLEFGGNKMSGSALRLLKLIPSLTSLSVAGEQRTDSGLWNVAVTDLNIDEIAALRQLESLDLEGAAITNRGVAKLSQLEDLKLLSLSRTQVSGAGLAALQELKRLQHLKLWDCPNVDDDAVSELLGFPELAILELQETKISDEGLRSFGQLKNLRRLYLGGTETTPAALEALGSRLPGCTLSWWQLPDVIAAE